MSPERALRLLSAAGRRLRGDLPAGWLLSWLLCLWVASVVGGSTTTADWVPGSEALSSLAVTGTILTGLLALLRVIPGPAALGAIGVAGLALAVRPVGTAALQQSFGVLLAGDVLHAGPAFLFLLALLMWVQASWLTWCVLRWRQPLLGLIPGAAALATNVLNTDGQNGAAFLFVSGTLALLLWTAYKRSLEEALAKGLRLSSEARWDFWESGAVAGLALLAIGVLAPPMSTVDHTLDAQTGVIKAWADMQVRLHHAGGRAPGGPSTPLSTGFSDTVQLGRPLNRTGTVVFTYRVQGGHSTPLYFRGVDIVATTDGQWTYLRDLQQAGTLAAGAQPPYQDIYKHEESVTVAVSMSRPPSGDPGVYFYPGQLARLNRPAVVSEEFYPAPGTTDPNLHSVDRLTTLGDRPVTGGYSVISTYSVADAAELRKAGTDYPAWVQPYRSLADWMSAVRAAHGAPGPVALYRDDKAVAQITALARRVTAGKTTPYDQAAAIELFLRSSQFKYTLKPPPTPAGQDPLAFFLFDSRKGYCEYFATAMGDMLRALGIPTRLVNGYGPGSFSAKDNHFVVREADAHTWVEAYFPSYGWIPFEPTPDGTYIPIPRGFANCHTDSPLCDAAAAAGALAGRKSGHFDDTGSEQQSEALKPLPAAPKRPDPTPWVLGGLAVFLAVGVVAGVRFLSPRSPGSAWRRTRLLGRLAGLPDMPSETPLEFGRRLAAAVPAVAAEASRMASGFTLAAYGPPELAPAGAEDVMAGWQRLRPALLREAAARAARRAR